MRIKGPQAIYVPEDGHMEITEATGCCFSGDIPPELLDMDARRRDGLAANPSRAVTVKKPWLGTNLFGSYRKAEAAE